MTNAEYQRRYYARHREEIIKKRKEYKETHHEELKQKRKEYYHKNKEKLISQSKEYIKRNRKKITKMINARRKKVAEELKQKGMIYTYLSKSERENKMVTSLAKKCNISEEKAREFLVSENWNYIKIITLWKGMKLH